MLSHLEACSVETEVHLQTGIQVPGSELWGLSEQGPSCEKGTIRLVDSQSIVATMVRYQSDMMEDIR